MKPDIKDKLEALMRQADFHAERFDKRREYSWKIALAFWGAILGASTQLREASLTSCEICVGGFFVVVLHAFWLRSVFYADQDDKWVLFQSRDESLSIINSIIAPKKIKHPKPSYDRHWLEDWSVLFQIGTTTLLVIAISSLVFR
jgi:hypothetical protein